MHTVLLQAVRVLLKGRICRCTASNAVLCLIVSAAEDKSRGTHLQLQLGFAKACTQLLSNMSLQSRCCTYHTSTQGTCCAGY